jgi:hypothetical protein
LHLRSFELANLWQEKRSVSFFYPTIYLLDVDLPENLKLQVLNLFEFLSSVPRMKFFPYNGMRDSSMPEAPRAFMKVGRLSTSTLKLWRGRRDSNPQLSG